jgi:hypothetical protein
MGSFGETGLLAMRGGRGRWVRLVESEAVVLGRELQKVEALSLS